MFLKNLKSSHGKPYFSSFFKKNNPYVIIRRFWTYGLLVVQLVYLLSGLFWLPMMDDVCGRNVRYLIFGQVAKQAAIEVTCLSRVGEEDFCRVILS